MKRRLLILLSLILLSGGFFQAQHLRFKHITNEDGLSTNYVTCILQDDKGFMWFGTQDGLNRYDGYQVRVFKNDPTNPNTLSSSEITSIVQHSPDLFMVGTLGGVNFFNPVTEQFSKLEDARVRGRVNKICRYDRDNYLIGMEEGVFLVNIRNRLVKSFSAEKKMNVTAVHVMNGIAFIGTEEDGLWKLAGSRLQPVTANAGDFRDFKPSHMSGIKDIKSYGEKLYVATADYGVYKIDANDLEVEKNIDIEDGVLSFEIADSKLYASTGKGLVIYKLLSGEKQYARKGEQSFSLNSIHVTCTFIDRQNNLWVGTNLGGVNVAFSQSAKFTSPISKFETEFTNIYSFYEEKADQVWLGGVHRLLLLNTHTGSYTDYSKMLRENTALCISQESENVFWIGTWGDGLIRFDRATQSVKRLLDKEFGGTVLCLQIHGDFLYAGTVGDGLFRVNLRTYAIRNFGTADGLPNPNINTIFKDSRGNVWLGTYDGGLVKLKGFPEGETLEIAEKFRSEGKPNQLASNIVLGINEDLGGSIWVATSNGLSKMLADKRFYNFYEKDGLANAYLYSILKDSANHFWMSSNGGLIRFNPAQNEKDIVFKNYGFKDGLVNKEFNMGAAFSGKSGTLYFGGANGFNLFRPAAIKDNMHLPRVYVVSYQRGGSDVKTDSVISYKKYLNLSWRQNYFQFEVAALDYTDPSKNKYRYMLEGYDSDWSAPTNVRYVSYTELPGGDYTFKVKAANNDGVWNETPFEIRITVVPPFWKTKWFYVLLAMFSVGMIYAYTQYRTKAIKNENKILENKVAERTRELEEKNRDITSSIEYAKRIQEAILPSKNVIFSRFSKAFILYKPKDIVSGDFYWYGEKNGVKIFAVVDCTGHGVPGAFMSMIGHNLMHQIIQEKGITEPGEILNHLHRGVQEALRQGQNEINTNDGMDISLLAVDEGKGRILWAGANRPLILISSEGAMTRYDGNKFPVGGAQLDVNRMFTTHAIPTQGGSMAYMFTDGYADQFGGEKGKKFMAKRFHELLLSIHDLTADRQREQLEQNMERWMQNHEQVDDILVVGIAI